MIDALIRGKLIKAPEARTTKTGKPMATARMRVPTSDPDVTIFTSVVAFEPEAVAALLALGEGDSVSVAGPVKVGMWTDKEGNTRPNVDVVADRVLSVYAIRKARAAGGGGQPLQRNGSTDKPTHAAWLARQVNRPADFAGFDDLGF